MIAPITVNHASALQRLDALGITGKVDDQRPWKQTSTGPNKHMGNRLDRLGISIDQVKDSARDDGVNCFHEAFDQLSRAVRSQRRVGQSRY